MIKVYLAAFGAALIGYAALDLLWVGVAAHDLYRQSLGHLMAAKVRWGALALCYPLYAAGVVFFAAGPGIETRSLKTAAVRGAALGLLVYGTYDLTNLAVLRGWRPEISMMDVAWGTFATSFVSAAACHAGLRVER